MSDDGSMTADSPGGDTSVPAAGAGSDDSGVASSVDYRDQLRSQRWDAAPLENPEAQKTDPRIAVAAIVVLSAITFVLIVLGYSSGVWG